MSVVTRVASIDIGTNTFLCLIAEVVNGKIETIISDKVETVRLGEGVHKNREFLLSALERADRCLDRFAQDILANNVSKVGAVATSAARDVKNGYKLLEIGTKHGIPITIVGGEKEAKLTFEGVCTNPLFDSSIVVVDVGGGSTEVTYLDQSGQIKGTSYDIGGVRLTELFVKGHPTTQKEIAEIKSYAQGALSSVAPQPTKKIVAVAGTPTTIAALELGVDYTREIIEGYRLSLKTIEKWVTTLAPMTLEERSKIKGLEPKRADIILAGATILAETVKALGAQELYVSTRGVRYGLAAELGQ